MQSTSEARPLTKPSYGSTGNFEALTRRSFSLNAMDWKGASGGQDSLVAGCLLVVAGLCLGIILYVLRTILIPFSVAVLFYYLLQPLVNALNNPPWGYIRSLGRRDPDMSLWEHTMQMVGMRRDSRSYMPVADRAGAEMPDDTSHDRCGQVLSWLRFPRSLSVLLGICFAVGVFCLFGFIIYDDVQSLNTEWPLYEYNAERLAQRLKVWLDRIHVSLADDLVPYVMDHVKELIPTLLSGASSAVANSVLVLIFLVYLLAPEPQPFPAGVWRKIDSHVRRYIRLKTLVCGIVASAVGAMLFMVGVPFPGLFALITFVLNYIPNFGPIVATLLPVPLVVLSPYMPLTRKILSVVLPSTAHFICGYWLEPTLFGEHLEVHPIVILLSLAFWSVLWGVPGMILSVPITAILRITCQHFDHPYARVAVSLFEGKLIEFEELREPHGGAPGAGPTSLVGGRIAVPPPPGEG